MFARIRRLMPYSDALEGPLADLTLSGERLAKTLAEGVVRGSPGLHRAMRAVFDGTSSEFRNLSLGAPQPIGAVAASPAAGSAGPST